MTSFERPSAARVANAFHRASLASQMDALARCQILEGAYGLGNAPWSDLPDPEAGLRKAQQYVSRQTDDHLSPEWFLPRQVSCYRLLEAGTKMLLRSSKVTDLSADDIIQSVLGGVGTKGNENKRGLWGAGDWLSVGIRTGKETPAKVAAGLGGKFFRNKALNAIKVQQNQEDRTGPTVNVGPSDEDDKDPIDPSLTKWKSPVQGMIEILLDKDDPLGHKLQEFLRQIWRAYPPRAQDFMNFWLDELLRTGHPPGTTEMGNAFGVSAQAINRTYVKFTQEDLPKFRQKLDNSPLGDLLNQRLELDAMGLSL